MMDKLRPDSKNKAHEIVLQDRQTVLSQAAPVGTPPGNHSINDYFGTKKARVNSKQQAALDAYKQQEDSWAKASAIDKCPATSMVEKESAWQVAEEAFEAAMAADTEASLAFDAMEDQVVCHIDDDDDSDVEVEV